MVVVVVVVTVGVMAVRVVLARLCAFGDFVLELFGQGAESGLDLRNKGSAGRLPLLLQGRQLGAERCQLRLNLLQGRQRRAAWRKLLAVQLLLKLQLHDGVLLLAHGLHELDLLLPHLLQLGALSVVGLVHHGTEHQPWIDWCLVLSWCCCLCSRCCR